MTYAFVCPNCPNLKEVGSTGAFETPSPFYSEQWLNKHCNNPGHRFPTYAANDEEYDAIITLRHDREAYEASGVRESFETFMLEKYNLSVPESAKEVLAEVFFPRHNYGEGKEFGDTPLLRAKVGWIEGKNLYRYMTMGMQLLGNSIIIVSDLLGDSHRQALFVGHGDSYTKECLQKSMVIERKLCVRRDREIYND